MKSYRRMFIFHFSFYPRKMTFPTLLIKWYNTPSSFIFFFHKFCLMNSKFSHFTFLFSAFNQSTKLSKNVLYFCSKKSKHSKDLKRSKFDFCFVFEPWQWSVFFKNNNKTPRRSAALSKSRQKPCCRRENLGRDFPAENIRCRGKREQTFTAQ